MAASDDRRDKSDNETGKDAGASNGKPETGTSAVGSALMVVDPPRKGGSRGWLPARAAVIAIAAIAGAAGGAALSFGAGYGFGVADARQQAVEPTEALRASIRQLTTEITALKAVVTRPPAQPAVSTETTGLIAPARSPADNWTLYRVRNGRALVEGNGGYYEVAPGSNLPGLGPVQRITRQDGAWVVETRAGTIRPRG
ncbi:hypothetical protein [Bauldia sp.]|uniref:hypothetical protein n=1 Tax=Bauldia sp. TaxID=2575872 RepID=UPI003BAA7E5B